MVLEVVRDSMLLIVLSLSDMVELDLCLVVGNRGVLGATDYVAFLINRV